MHCPHKQHRIKSTEIIRIFFRRNLQIKNEHTKSMTHKSLVSSNLEYYSTISPHTKKQKSKIWKIQRRATSYTTGRFRDIYAGPPRMEFPRNMQKHCQSLYAIHNYTQSGCHQSRLLYLFSDITHTTQSVFDTSPLAHPLTTSNSASSLVQLSFGMHYHLIVSLLLLWISLNHRSKPTTT